MKKILFIAVALFASLFTVSNTYAEESYTGPMIGFTMSPMTQRLSLKPGETYKGSFYIANPEENSSPVTYNIVVQGFYRDEANNPIFEDVKGRSQIVDWITINSPETNTIAPNSFDQIFYTINVPDNPPAGGQYAAITVISAPIKNTIMISESVAMNYTIFADVDGQNDYSSEITDLSLPFIMFDGNITASAKVKNTGNVHGTATSTLKITSLFSGGTVFSNEESPEKKLVLPDRTMALETTWENTPSFGIFNANYKVEFEGGEVKEISKLIIKCPIWMILAVLIGLTGLILVIVKTIKSKNKKIPVSNRDFDDNN